MLNFEYIIGIIHYNKQVDLHKPYVDNYWFEIEGNIYKRIPEVMDCWFESGAMPFGQANYLGDQTYSTNELNNFFIQLILSLKDLIKQEVGLELCML
jgi:isoleucyl-tRNA synthetase